MTCPIPTFLVPVCLSSSLLLQVRTAGARLLPEGARPPGQAREAAGGGGSSSSGSHQCQPCLSDLSSPHHPSFLLRLFAPHPYFPPRPQRPQRRRLPIHWGSLLCVIRRVILHSRWYVRERACLGLGGHAPTGCLSVPLDGASGGCTLSPGPTMASGVGHAGKVNRKARGGECSGGGGRMGRCRSGSGASALHAVVGGNTSAVGPFQLPGGLRRDDRRRDSNPAPRLRSSARRSGRRGSGGTPPPVDEPWIWI